MDTLWGQLASVYRMDTVMVDQEPHRSVQLIRRIDTRLPSPLLSQYVASTLSTMGRLIDVRLGAGRGVGVGVGVGVGAGSGSGSGGSVWSGTSEGLGIGASGSGSASTGKWSTVAKSALGTPRSGSGTPVRVPSPVVRSREVSPSPGRSSRVSGVGASTGAGAGTSGGSKDVWVSPSVQAQRVRENAVAGGTGSMPLAVVEAQGAGAGREAVEDVPDDWEDDV